jgi:hypothetical protein
MCCVALKEKLVHWRERIAGPSGRVAWDVGLQRLACWDCEFETHRFQGSLYWMLVLPGRSLCGELITRPEESYRLLHRRVWYRNLVTEETLAHWGAVASKEREKVKIKESHICEVSQDIIWRRVILTCQLSFLGVESGRGMTLTPHPLLVPRSKNRMELYLYSP